MTWNLFLTLRRTLSDVGESCHMAISLRCKTHYASLSTIADSVAIFSTSPPKSTFSDPRKMQTGNLKSLQTI